MSCARPLRTHTWIRVEPSYRFKLLYTKALAIAQGIVENPNENNCYLQENGLAVQFDEKNLPMTAQAPVQQRAYWLKTLHQWHWISSALCLLGLLLFAVTGFTLNHAAQIEAKPSVINKKAELPASLQTVLAGVKNDNANKDIPLPRAVQKWLNSELAVDVGNHPVEWSPEEAYIALPRPGGDAWLRIDRGNGEVEYELTSRGWISYLNDLHKGRNTGTAWSWFIDIFAAACLVFSITGLFILKMHANNRAMTWPLVGLGVLIPFLLALLFIH